MHENIHDIFGRGVLTDSSTDLSRDQLDELLAAVETMLRGCFQGHLR
jgi:hypothetical protein